VTRHDLVRTATAVVLASAPAWGGGTCVTPANEDCGDEIVFDTGDLPYVTAGMLGCVNDVPDKPYFDVFFRYDCTITGPHEFGLCDSDGDTYIRIYTGGCGFLDGDEFAVGDDDCPGSPPNADPLIIVDLAAGNSYWIEIGTWRPDPPWGAPNLPYTFTVRRLCSADLTGAAGAPDGVVDALDFLALIAQWGTPCLAPCTADIAGPDGNVDSLDFLLLIGQWGSPGNC
jgi:hypothetical protein